MDDFILWSSTYICIAAGNIFHDGMCFPYLRSMKMFFFVLFWNPFGAKIAENASILGLFVHAKNCKRCPGLSKRFESRNFLLVAIWSATRD